MHPRSSFLSPRVHPFQRSQHRVAGEFYGTPPNFRLCPTAVRGVHVQLCWKPLHHVQLHRVSSLLAGLLRTFQLADLRLDSGLEYEDNSPINENGGLTSGLDAVNIRTATSNFPVLPETTNGALATDMEGIALAADGELFSFQLLQNVELTAVQGTFWASDEYGPTIYHIAADGTILSAIEPPAAILPHLADGTLYFETEGETPTYGRVPNQVGHLSCRVTYPGCSTNFLDAGIRGSYYLCG